MRDGAPTSSRLSDGLVRAELIVTGILAALQLILVFRLPVNWDEFRFLSLIYEYKRGTLSRGLQTAHVHLFGWLTHLGQNEVDQIVAARLGYWLLLVGSTVLLYLVGRKILSRPAALFAVVCFLSYSDIIGHGTSFRADGLSLFLLLAGVALLLRQDRGYAVVVASGASVAAALAVTIKAVFFLPTLALALLAANRQMSVRARSVRLIAFAGAVAVVFGMLYGLHAASLAGVTPERSAGYARRAGEKMLRLDDLFPRFDYLILTFLSNAFIWVLLGIGTGLAVIRAIRFRESRFVLTLILVLPLASIAVYRNAFPYFYVLVMPTAFVACALPMDEMLRQTTGSIVRSSSIVAMALAVLLGASLNYVWFLQDDDLASQRRLVSYVHEVFPTPVPYIDGHDVISSFPKAGFFMSTWGFEKYRAGGEPVFGDLLARPHPPVFVLATNAALRLDRAEPTREDPYQLFPEDLRLLKENFVHEWGPLFVAGKRVRPGRAGHIVDVFIGGEYVVEAAEPVRVGHEVYSPGATVALPRGPVELAAARDSALVILRWAHRVATPPDEPTRPVFRGFYPCAHPLAGCRD